MQKEIFCKEGMGEFLSLNLGLCIQIEEPLSLGILRIHQFRNTAVNPSKRGVGGDRHSATYPFLLQGALKSTNANLASR